MKEGKQKNVRKSIFSVYSEIRKMNIDRLMKI